MNNSIFHKRHRDHETFDEIRIKTIPRYKTSSLSRDEWRISAQVELLFKGKVILTRDFSRIDVAVQHLGAFIDQDMIPEKIIELEKTKCDQAGCPNDAVSKFYLKKLYSQRGEELAEKKHSLTYYRQFCKKHLRRGDCGLEDADRNYEVVEGPAPGESTNLEESPTSFGGVINIGKKSS